MKDLSVLLLTSQPLAAPWNGGDKNLARSLLLADGSVGYTFLAGEHERAEWGEGNHPIRVRAPKDIPRLSDKLRMLDWTFRRAPTADVTHVMMTFRRPWLGGTIFSMVPAVRRGALIVTCLNGSSLPLPLLRKATRIAVISARTRDTLAAAGIHNVEVIRPGVDLGLFVPRDNGEAQRSMELEAAPTMLFAGHHDAGAGLDAALEVCALIAARVPNVRLLLAMRFRRWQSRQRYSGYLQLRLQELGIRDRVIDLDEGVDMLQAIQASHVLLFQPNHLTLKMELPLTLIEGLACGRPAVVSNLQPLDEVGGFSRSVHVAAPASTETVDHLERLLLDAAHYKELSLDARSLAESRYSISLMASAYSELYRVAAARNDRPRATSLQPPESEVVSSPPRATAARASAMLAVSFIAIGAGNYAFSITLAHLLQPRDFGVLQLVQTFVLFAAWFTNAGFPWTAAKSLPAEPDHNRQASIIAGALFGNLVVASILGGILILLVPLGVLKLGSASGLPFTLAALACALLGLNAAAKGALQGMFRFGTVALAGLLELAVKLIVGLTLARAGWGPVGAALGILAGMAAATALTLFSLRSWLSIRSIGLANAQLYRQAARLFFGTAGVALLSSIDVFAVKLLEPVAQSNERAGLYQAAVTLGRLPFFFAMAITAAVYSQIAQPGANAELYVRKGMLYIFALLTPIGLAMIVEPEPILHIFFPASYAPAAAALRPIAIGTIVLSVVAFLAGAAQAVGDERFAAKALLAAVAVEAICLWLVIPIGVASGGTWDLVFAGAAFAGAGLLAAAALGRRLWVRFEWGLGIRRMMAYLVCSLVFVLTVIILPHASAIGVIASATAATAIYALLAASLGLLSRGDLRTLVAGSLRRNRRAPAPTGER